MYEPDSYVPLARLDGEGERTEQGGLGTTQDAQQPGTSKTIAASAYSESARGQKHSKTSTAAAANDTEAQYWAALATQAQQQNTPGTGTHGVTAQARLCEVYYFHTDQVGLPEELSNAQGQLVWQAQYKNDGANGIRVGHPNPHGRMHTGSYNQKVYDRLSSVEQRMQSQGYGRNAIRAALRRELRTIGREPL